MSSNQIQNRIEAVCWVRATTGTPIASDEDVQEALSIYSLVGFKNKITYPSEVAPLGLPDAILLELERGYIREECAVFVSYQGKVVETTLPPPDTFQEVGAGIDMLSPLCVNFDVAREELIAGGGAALSADTDTPITGVAVSISEPDQVPGGADFCVMLVSIPPAEGETVMDPVVVGP